jgi:hypothetical protein
MGDKFAGGVAERLDEELNSLIQDYETIKEFADFLANSTPEQRQALLNKYGDAAKKLFTDSEYRGQVGEAIVEAFKEGITDDIEKFTRIKSGDEKDIGYTTTHAALMAYGMWKRYGKKIGKDVVRAVDDDVAKNTVDSKTLKKKQADDVGEGEDIPTRPSWRESELDTLKEYPGYKEQQSFLNRKEVPHGTKNSSRPELFLNGHSIEVKNYDVNKNSSALISNISKQVLQRNDNLPLGTKQTIIIDVRGQNVSNEKLRVIREKILFRTNNSADIIFRQR